MVLKGRFEVSGYGVGSIAQISDKDMDTDLRTRSLGSFIERKLNEIIGQHLELKVIKRTSILDILELKDACRYGATGLECDEICGLCAIRNDMADLNGLYIRRNELGKEGQRRFFRTLLKVLSNEHATGLTLAGFDNLENIVLFVALEQLRITLSLHIRGCKLSYAPNLELLLSFVRRGLDCFNHKDETRFMDTRGLQTSVFNDNNGDCRETERKHMIHCVLDFTSGYIIGGHSLVKRAWKDEDTEEILTKKESMVRKLKHTVFHNEKVINFKPPIFDTETKTFKCMKKECDCQNDIGAPLIPSNAFNRNLIL